jgi:hypothetical protein
MLVVDAGCSTPGSASPSLLDSPTLARVERARLRQEGGGSAAGVGGGGTSPLHHAACCQVSQHKSLLYLSDMVTCIAAALHHGSSIGLCKHDIHLVHYQMYQCALYSRGLWFECRSGNRLSEGFRGTP